MDIPRISIPNRIEVLVEDTSGYPIMQHELWLPKDPENTRLFDMDFSKILWKQQTQNKPRSTI